VSEVALAGLAAHRGLVWERCWDSAPQLLAVLELAQDCSVYPGRSEVLFGPAETLNAG
jgi:hypothetical protein